MDINSLSPSLAPKKTEFKKPTGLGDKSLPDQGIQTSTDYDRIENENGVVLTGPAFYRGEDEIRDVAAFSVESMDALSASQEQL